MDGTILSLRSPRCGRNSHGAGDLSSVVSHVLRWNVLHGLRLTRSPASKENFFLEDLFSSVAFLNKNKVREMVIFFPS